MTMPGLFLIISIGAVIYAGTRFFAGPKTNVKDRS
jgi:hypothetical protein